MTAATLACVLSPRPTTRRPKHPSSFTDDAQTRRKLPSETITHQNRPSPPSSCLAYSRCAPCPGGNIDIVCSSELSLYRAVEHGRSSVIGSIRKSRKLLLLPSHTKRVPIVLHQAHVIDRLSACLRRNSTSCSVTVRTAGR